ncbi:hypothetical protein GGI00_003926 [Coemansia sp. RSA 2681]|nr:hypothetical protein GGI00_003926 [Coemansia sp. RSA 2681]
MELVVRVTKKASDSDVEYYHTFDLAELELDIETAKLYKLYNKDGIYGRDYVVERCFTNSKYVDSDDEEDEDKDDEEEEEVEEEKKEALGEWVDIAKEVTDIGEQVAAAAAAAEDQEAEEDKESDEESEEEDDDEDDDNPYRLILQGKNGQYKDVNGDMLLKNLFKGGELIITLK